MSTFLLGMNAKIYQGAAGGDLATLTEMSNVKDVTLNLEAGEADVTTFSVGEGAARRVTVALAGEEPPTPDATPGEGDGPA